MNSRMSYSAADMSNLRAKIAKRTVQLHVETSCKRLRESLQPGRLEAPPLPVRVDTVDELHPNLPPPGLKKMDLGSSHDSIVEPVPLNVGIVGGGMAGLYASLILEDLGIEHEVLEASNTSGGRVRTHRFSLKEGDYYEVGAMFFPDTPVMSRTFKLLQLLNITKDSSPNPQQGTLIPGRFGGLNNPMFFNNIFKTAATAAERVDPFQVGTGHGGRVSERSVYNTTKGFFYGCSSYGQRRQTDDACD
jgi:hypothetical protein